MYFKILNLLSHGGIKDIIGIIITISLRSSNSILVYVISVRKVHYPGRNKMNGQLNINFLTSLEEGIDLIGYRSHQVFIKYSIGSLIIFPSNRYLCDSHPGIMFFFSNIGIT